MYILFTAIFLTVPGHRKYSKIFVELITMISTRYGLIKPVIDSPRSSLKVADSVRVSDQGRGKSLKWMTSHSLAWCLIRE